MKPTAPRDDDEPLPAPSPAETAEVPAGDTRDAASRSTVGLPGAVHGTDHRQFWLARRSYEPAYVHGAYALGQLATVSEPALALLGVPDLGPRPAFLDTETTGLAGGTGTLAFLIGVGVWTGDDLDLHLIFMRDPSEEPAALHHLTSVLAGATGIVTFNGRGFDVPILQTRYIVNRMPPTALVLPHLDLLTVARQLWRDHLPSRRLGVLETQILRVIRTGQDIESALIPYLYRVYLETGETVDMVRIFYHNEIDVLSLASLLVHVARMVDEPEGMRLAPAEWVGVGRVFDRAGREDDAMAAWRRAVSGEDGELDASCAARLWDEIGARHRRRGDLDAALKVWDAWMAADPWAVSPLVEKAKYYEWAARDLAQALVCTEQALRRAGALPRGMERFRVLADLGHRRERLQRRLAREKSGEPDTDSEPDVARDR